MIELYIPPGTPCRLCGKKKDDTARLCHDCFIEFKGGKVVDAEFR